MQEPAPGRAIFLPVLLPHIIWFSISCSAIAIAFSIDVIWIAKGLFVAGLFSAAGFAYVLYKEDQAQDKILTHHLERHAAITDSIRPQSIPIAPAKRIPFPPVRFVVFIFDVFDKTGKFPTVAQCIENKFARAQEYYTQCVDAGAIRDRIDKQTAGIPVWSHDRFMQAAIADNADQELRDALSRNVQVPTA
jgi:hypothetical protein